MKRILYIIAICVLAQSCVEQTSPAKVDNTTDEAQVVNTQSNSVEQNTENKQTTNDTFEPIPIDREDGFYAMLSYVTTNNQFDSVELEIKPVITKSHIESIKKDVDTFGNRVLLIQLTREGAVRFSTLTTANVGKPIAFVADKKIITMPAVNEPIMNGKIKLSGDFSEKEMDEIIKRLSKRE